MTKAQTLYFYKIIKIVMIGENKNLIPIAFKILLSYFENFNNISKLIFLNFVEYFCKFFLS